MRPQSLAEVARLTVEGGSFDRHLANFLDDFYPAPSAKALADEPVWLAPSQGEKGQIADAYLAATAEELSRQFNLAVPEWTPNPARALHRPWFACSLASLRAVLILESPPGFRCRNLFVSENALSRA